MQAGCKIVQLGYGRDGKREASSHQTVAVLSRHRVGNMKVLQPGRVTPAEAWAPRGLSAF
jgi:hypothetical protein